MIKFEKLGTDVVKIKKYIDKTDINFCDISIGTKYLWRNDFIIDYAVVDDTLIMKETCKDYKDAFYYPIGDNVEKALNEIEAFCKENAIPLLFCCIDNAKAAQLSNRYDNVSITNDRNWSDYIYDAEAFKTYRSKKYAGQRNHVNKFKKSYPDYKFCDLTEKEFCELDEFFSEYKRENVMTMWTEKEEAVYVEDYIKKAHRLKQDVGIMTVGGKIAGVAAGEVVNDTLIVHVEKALKKYEGIYPALAQAFVKRFATENVKYINREEDCGDLGLRTSKMQYHPIEIKEKNLVKVSTCFDNIKPPILIKTERLVISDIEKTDKKAYMELYTDKETNRFWGYDYLEDLKGEPNEDYFYNFQQMLKEKKEEYTFAVRLEGQYIGELVLYNFDYFGTAEIGFRFFKQYRGKGYAFESCHALLEYAFEELKIKKAKSRCFKINEASKKLLNKLNFCLIEQDEEKFYYILEQKDFK